MEFNYHVHWELDDEFIDEIVDDVMQKMAKNGYPLDENIDDCVDAALADLDAPEYDKFNIDDWYGKLCDEVEKRCKERIAKPVETKTNKYYVEIVNHILIEDDNSLFERIIERNCKGIRQDDRDVKEAINYIEKRLGLTFQSTVYPPVGTAQISAVYREDGEPILEA